MLFKLLGKTNKNYTPTQQILYNRGIEPGEVYHYLHTTDADIFDYNLFPQNTLKEAQQLIDTAIAENWDVGFPIDCDNDGFTSGALVINWLYLKDAYFATHHIHWYHHEGKQHGLQDCVDWCKQFKLIISIDGGTNDFKEHELLHNLGIEVIVLDHHDLDAGKDISATPAKIINNQTCDYPNKQLSGAGVAWQFCRYLDDCYNTNYANDLLDLAAIGMIGDMMSLKSIETKHLINKGLQLENIHNPFIYGMWKKNEYQLKDKITPWGATFYIVPLINAINRSGTLDEKRIVFESMLMFKAYEQIPSIKRGHKPGELESVLDQALRTCTNVKNRQTKVQDTGMELLEGILQKNPSMWDNKVLLFLLPEGKMSPNIAGLAANKIIGKYQRPVCVLTHAIDEDGDKVYRGSARGCEQANVADFKKICENTGVTKYQTGHPGAFGVSIPEDKIDMFIQSTNAQLINMPTEKAYFVDYLFSSEQEIDSQIILDISDLDNLWGTHMPVSLIGFNNLYVDPSMVHVYTKKDNTLKISLPTSKIDLILFKAPDELCEILSTQQNVLLQIVGECNKNEWYGNITPQIYITDWEIKPAPKYLF